MAFNHSCFKLSGGAVVSVETTTMTKLPDDVKKTQDAMMAGVRAFMLQKVREVEQRQAIATELIGEAFVDAVRSNPALAAAFEKYITFSNLEEARAKKLTKRLQIKDVTLPSLLKVLDIDTAAAASTASEAAAAPSQQAVPNSQLPSPSSPSGPGVRPPFSPPRSPSGTTGS